MTHRIIQALDELMRLSSEERLALGRLDLAHVASLAQEKQAILDDLRRGELQQLSDSKLSPEERLRMKTAVRRLIAASEAQVVLLHDAIEGIGTKLGLLERSSTYDGRARLHQGADPLANAQI
ncbi:MAG: hypothetical protein U1E65_36320 [Myxococcota bacterium]